ncbi:MAG: type II secretion system secretin GspD [bacterium]|nr:type II secretion system secretin GspD [bacterium]
MLKRLVAILGITLFVFSGCATQHQTEASKEAEPTENFQLSTEIDMDKAIAEENIHLKKIEELLGATLGATELDAAPVQARQDAQKTPKAIQLTGYDLEAPVQGNVFQTTVVPENPSFSEGPVSVGLNFDDADIYDVTKVVSEITKKSFIIDKDVAGTVTIFSESPMTPEQVFELYRTVLELNGLAIVQIGDFYKIENKDKAQQRYLVEDPGTVLERNDRLVTRVVKLKHIHGDAVQQALEDLVPEGKEIVVYPDDDGDTLIITDLLSNVNKILAVIEQIDVSRYADQFLEIIPVQYADLLDLVSDLSNILALRSEIPTLQADPLSGDETIAQAPAVSQTSSEQIVPAGTRTRIYPITRINSLVVSTNEPEVVVLVRKWVNILDHPTTGEKDASGERQTYVYPVQYSTAEELTPVLVDVYAETGQPAISFPEEVPEGEEQPNQPIVTDDLISLRDDDEPAPIFIPDTKNNSIIVKATPRQYAEIQTLLEKLDKRPLQVLIDVMFGEVQLQDTDIFGVQGMVMGQGQVTIGGETNTIETVTETIFSNVIPIDSEGFRFVAAAPGRFLMQLRALATQNKFKVLSDPHILVRHNETATINIGDDIPISETTGTGDNLRQNITYRTTGISLEVTPRVNNRGDVVMNITQEVSDVGQESFGDTGAASFTTRKTTTSVVTRDNYPLIMGGLISSRGIESRQGVPLMKDIPLLGKLFRYNEQQNRRVELIILVTPRVVKDPDEGWTLTENVLAERIKRLEEFFNREETDADKIKRYFK